MRLPRDRVALPQEVEGAALTEGAPRLRPCAVGSKSLLDSTAAQYGDKLGGGARRQRPSAVDDGVAELEGCVDDRGSSSVLVPQLVIFKARALLELVLGCDWAKTQRAS